MTAGSFEASQVEHRQDDDHCQPGVPHQLVPEQHLLHDSRVLGADCQSGGRLLPDGVPRLPEHL